MRLVHDCDEARWDAFVESAQTGYITQTWEWGLLTHLGTMHRIAVADDAGNYVTSVLLIEARAPLIGRPYLYAPRGPTCDDPQSPALTLLLQGVRELAQQHGCFMLKIEPQIADGDVQWVQRFKELGFKQNPYATHPRRSWMIDLHPSEDELLAGMSMSSRQNVRKGLKNLTIREGQGPEDLAHFYRIYQDTAQRDNFFIHPQSHYDEMITTFASRGKGCFWLAEYQGTPIAAQVVMVCGKVATSMFSASSSPEEYRKQRPNHPLQWTAIRWAKAHGCDIYDFRAISERLEPDAELYGLYTYKRGYGGYSWLSLTTHDLPYQPALYFAYRQALNLKRRREHQRHLAMLRERQQKDAPDAAKQPATTSSEP
ncbi:MAG TPA: peptidoglycan bridge formation glycyltransferase FemA/FemB family protein [Ktedonobacterales bacterium]|nr:peptidoglycan bridge formation glycyltransferase FemA/FemB family protein [Ktedonobacterales bacterium]